ncbi:MAG: hypothetical protein M9894_34570 [Planctomycetes bacterium]|nr:hypothetical protein [Planctomycetota bacterium]
MQKTLRVSLATGRVQLEGVPAEGASDEEKNERALQVVDEVKAELAEVAGDVDEASRGALLRLWVLRCHLDAHPVRWIKNYALRAKWNEAAKEIDALRERAAGQLPDGHAATIWEDLPYVRDALGLLFDKLRAQGEVQRLILTPLGKLTFAKVRYQREGPEDLARVCRELEEVVAGTGHLDDEVARWGDQNLPALLAGEPPRVIPPALAPSFGPGGALLVVGLGLVAGGVATLGGDGPTGPALLGLGALLAAAGAVLGVKAVGRLNKLPVEFADLAARFRERLYLIICLRGLYQMTSRLTRATDAFDRFLKDNGGVNRWKRVKVDDKDVTRLFAEGADAWHPKETIETWLSDQVTKTYRLDSQSLAAQADIDAEAWDAIMRAYKLSSDELGGDGRLLDVVADLLFVRRGEDIAAERARVFDEIYAAWDRAVEARRG